MSLYNNTEQCFGLRKFTFSESFEKFTGLEQCCGFEKKIRKILHWILYFFLMTLTFLFRIVFLTCFFNVIAVFYVVVQVLLINEMPQKLIFNTTK